MHEKKGPPHSPHPLTCIAISYMQLGPGDSTAPEPNVISEPEVICESFSRFHLYRHHWIVFSLKKTVVKVTHGSIPVRI